MKNRIVIALCLCTLLSLAVVGCSSNEVNKVEGLEDQGIKEAYSKVLKENEEGIKACSFIIEDFDDKDNAFCKPIAFLDLNGNGASELLYCTAGDNYDVEPNICTFQENKVVKLDIPTEGIEARFSNTSCWCVFGENNGDLLCVPYYDGDTNDYSYYALGKSAYEQPQNVSETIIEAEGGESNEYYTDDKDLSKAKGDALLKKWNGERKQLIFYYDDGSWVEDTHGRTFNLDSLIAPFKKSDALQMSYDEAMEILSQ